MKTQKPRLKAGPWSIVSGESVSLPGLDPLRFESVPVFKQCKGMPDVVGIAGLANVIMVALEQGPGYCVIEPTEGAFRIQKTD